jgi:hypothetical protein
MVGLVDEVTELAGSEGGHGTAGPDSVIQRYIFNKDFSLVFHRGALFVVKAPLYSPAIALEVLARTHPRCCVQSHSPAPEYGRLRPFDEIAVKCLRKRAPAERTVRAAFA